jgi:hypothetical protein
VLKPGFEQELVHVSTSTGGIDKGSTAGLDRGPALETSSYTAKLRACTHAGTSVRTATLSFGITIMHTAPYLTNG